MLEAFELETKQQSETSYSFCLTGYNYGTFVRLN